MKDSQIIEKLNQSLLSAKSALDAVTKWTQLLAEKNDIELDTIKKKAQNLTGFDIEGDSDEKIVEGIFDGQNMIGPDKTQYPVPANYASKSKLVEGDTLKLTIQPNGSFVFKQIELIPRKMTTGKLILEGNQYKVLCTDKTYSVLYASVTFFKGSVGDNVTIIIPEDEKASWGAIENIIPSLTPTEAK